MGLWACLTQCIRNFFQIVADDYQISVKGFSLFVGESDTDLLQYTINGIINLLADLVALVRQDQGALIAFGTLGFTGKEAVGFQIVQCTGNGCLILLATLAQIGCRCASVGVKIIQARHVSASQMVFCHLLILDLSNIAADSVNKNGKCFKSFSHRLPPIPLVENSTRISIAWAC